MLSLYGMLKCRLCCELLLLLNMSPLVCLLCRGLWSEHAVLGALLCSFSGCEEANVKFVVCIVGKMVHDVVGMV